MPAACFAGWTCHTLCYHPPTDGRRSLMNDDEVDRSICECDISRRGARRGLPRNMTDRRNEPARFDFYRVSFNIFSRSSYRSSSVQQPCAHGRCEAANDFRELMRSFSTHISVPQWIFVRIRVRK